MQNDEWRIRLRTACLRRDKEGGKGPITTWDSSTLNIENSALCAASHRLKRINGKECVRYQLIARATYLPKGHLVAAATYLRCAAVSVDRYSDLSPASPPVALTRNAGWVAPERSKTQEGKRLSAASRRMKKSGALDAAEDRGNFARGRAQALALCAQDRIERSIVRIRS